MKLSSRDYHSGNSPQVGQGAHLVPIAQEFLDLLLLRIADFHHQPASGLQNSMSLRNEPAIDIEALLSTEERAVRLVFANFTLLFFGPAFPPVGRMENEEVKCPPKRKIFLRQTTLR